MAVIKSNFPKNLSTGDATKYHVIPRVAQTFDSHKCVLSLPLLGLCSTGAAALSRHIFLCYCVAHVEHIRIWLWGAVIHLVLEPGGISDAPSHAARCKLPRYAIIAEAAVTQTDYKLCMNRRTILSFHTTIPLSQYCTTTFPLLPCLLFSSGLDGLLNRIFLWTVSVAVC